MVRIREASRLEFVHKKLSLFGRTIALLWVSAPLEITFIIFSSLLRGVIPTVSVWITKQVVDIVTYALSQGRTVDTITATMLIVSWIVALLLATLLPPWEIAAQGNFQEKLSARINLLLMQKADTLSDLSYFEDSHFYDQLQLLREKARERSVSLLYEITVGGRELFTVVSMLGLLFPIGWWVPLIIVAATIPQTFVLMKLEEKEWEIAEGKSLQVRRMEYCASVMLTDIYAKEVRLFGFGNFLLKRFQVAFKDFHRANRKFRHQQALWSTFLALLSAAGNAIAFWWVVQQAFAGQITPGNVLVFVQSLAYIQDGLAGLLYVPISFYQTLIYMENLFKFLDIRHIFLLNPTSKSVPTKISSGIKFENVHFSYPDGRKVFAGVSFTLHPGQTVALVGENGAGKTTLVKLLTRLYDPTEGNIWVDNINLKDLDLVAWRRQIAVVFQDFGHYSFTLEENIALADIEALSDTYRLQQAAEKANLDEFIAKLPEGYQTLLGKQFGGTELSGGQWQKLALARAFLREEAQILILDEPTAALDPRSEYEVYRSFAELTHGKTTLLITHRLASVRMADWILVLKQGQLIEQGTHEELISKNGEYALLWTMQTQQYQV